MRNKASQNLQRKSLKSSPPFQAAFRRPHTAYRRSWFSLLAISALWFTPSHVASASDKPSHIEFRLGIDEANHTVVRVPAEYVVETRSPRNVVSNVQLLGSIDGFKSLGSEKMRLFRLNPAFDPYVLATYEFLPKAYAGRTKWLQSKEAKALFTSTNELTHFSVKLIQEGDVQRQNGFLYRNSSGQEFEGLCSRYVCQVKTWSSISPMRLGLVLPTSELRTVESIGNAVERIWTNAVSNKSPSVSK